MLSDGSNASVQPAAVPNDQMKVAIERRLQLSNVAKQCGGLHMFAAAAAATVDEYIKWASEETKKDDGKIAKVFAH
jgi:hypothetical protein